MTSGEPVTVSFKDMEVENRITTTPFDPFKALCPPCPSFGLGSDAPTSPPLAYSTEVPVISDHLPLPPVPGPPALPASPPPPLILLVPVPVYPSYPWPGTPFPPLITVELGASYAPPPPDPPF